MSEYKVEIEQSGSKIIATVFTHKHPDHIGDLSEISKFYQAPIFASKETLFCFTVMELIESSARRCNQDLMMKNGALSKHMAIVQGTFAW